MFKIKKSNIGNKAKNKTLMNNDKFIKNRVSLFPSKISGVSEFSKNMTLIIFK